MVRPLRLLLDGFTSYREPCELDVSDLSVVAVCGPNGAGKSSLIDAMIWAPYGELPERAAAEVVNEDRDACRVEFDVEISSGIPADIGVHRFVRERGRSKTSALHVAPDGTETQDSKAVAAAARRIINADARRLGLTALARQGQIAAFASLPAKERRTFLSECVIGDLFDGIDIMARDERDGARARFDARGRELVALLAESGELERLQAEADEASAATERAGQRLRQLLKKAQGPDPAKLAAARTAAAELEDLLARRPTAVEAVESATEAAAEAAETAEGLEKTAHSARDVVSETKAEARSAEDEAAELRERIETLERGDELECWVCGSELDESALQGLRDDLAAADKRITSIGRAAKTARSRAEEAEREARKARQEARSRQRDTDEAVATVERIDKNAGIAEDAAAPLEELEAAAAAAEIDPAELEAAEAAHNEALRREGAAKERLDRAKEADEAVPAAREASDEAEREVRARENLLRAASPLGVPLLATMRAIDSFEHHANDAVSTLCSMGLKFSISDRRRAPEVLIEARDETGSWRKYHTFSGGEKMRFDIAMRVGLCRVTGVRADTLIIDEGHGALDPDSATNLQMLMWRLVDTSEMAAVWTVTHIPAVLDAFEEFILVDKGRRGSRARIEIR
ncbi:MAG: AAA family ATPase [Gemmatimonadetes bacterium]|nr:AAA family ATPase [Gemmatimonadota bacterium]